MGWIIPFAVAVGIPMVLGSIVGAQTADEIQIWYRTLKKPSWNPPDWFFGGIWSFLYLLMGVASFVVWANGGFAQQSGALTLYAVNLALNLAWMPIFFKAHNLQLAQFDNLATLATGIWLASTFMAIKPLAGYLLWPYVAFVAYANAVNLAIVKKNNGNDPLYEPLYTGDDKKNPGQAGYTPKPTAALPTTTRAAGPRSRSGLALPVRAGAGSVRPAFRPVAARPLAVLHHATAVRFA